MLHLMYVLSLIVQTQLQKKGKVKHRIKISDDAPYLDLGSYRAWTGCVPEEISA
jgi:hypothetical protein